MTTGTNPNEIKGLIKYFLLTEAADELPNHEFDIYTKKGDEVLI